MRSCRALWAVRFLSSVGNGGIGLLRELRGRVDADVTVAGTLAAPHPSGTLRFDYGTVALGGQSMRYRDLHVAISAANDRIQLDQLAVKLGNGSFNASGSAQLDGFDVPLGVDVSGQAIHFPIRVGSFAAFIDGKTELHGSRKDGVLAVAATVSDGLAQLPRMMSDKKPQSLTRNPDIQFTDAAAVRERAAEAAEAAEDAPTKASIKAHIPGPFRIRSSEIGADLEGDLDVEVLGEVMRISGAVDSTWGRLDLLGRRYELESARVRDVRRRVLAGARVGMDGVRSGRLHDLYVRRSIRDHRSAAFARRQADSGRWTAVAPG